MDESLCSLTISSGNDSPERMGMERACFGGLPTLLLHYTQDMSMEGFGLAEAYVMHKLHKEKNKEDEDGTRTSAPQHAKTLFGCGCLSAKHLGGRKNGVVMDFDMDHS
ncbi:hypothetical protein PIB30_036181 [Stylosanthes scabra]|uniref:Uncharacterized protein n=1 Tax=Stylosanthes scabra TaxID=79078 RepID=A0ABU6RDV8_9FABA|nr:hypothetical protein [Stylosanthes scabra]